MPRLPTTATPAKRHVAAAALFLTVSGCSSLFDAPPHEPTSYETVMLFYKPLVATALKPLVGGSAIEVSELRKSVAPQPGDWATCARAWKDGKLVYYSVFFRNRAVFETRPSNYIDLCETAQFSSI